MLPTLADGLVCQRGLPGSLTYSRIEEAPDLRKPSRTEYGQLTVSIGKVGNKTPTLMSARIPDFRQHFNDASRPLRGSKKKTAQERVGYLEQLATRWRETEEKSWMGLQDR